MHGEIFKARSRNSATFKMEVFATIGNSRNFIWWASPERASSDGRTTNGQYLHVAAVTRPSLQPKLKADENDHPLKVTPGIVSCFVDVFCTFCQKRQLLSVSQHSISIWKLIIKLKTGYIVNIIFQGSNNRSNH